MSRQDNEVKSGAPSMYKDNRDGGVLIPHPVIGIVKDNIDPSRNGRIRVYLTDYGGADPNDDKSWVTVSYMSPWFGATQSSAAPADDGAFLTNSQSYGLWATAPDIGTEVICIFVNGRPNQGYYVGCLPKPGAHFMVPAIGAAANVIPNGNEATTYGGADRLPVTEINVTNPKYRDSTVQYQEPKPIHSYQAALLSTQGLIRDNVRGVIGSTSMRESPSAVFGLSTPGAPIWSGGYTRATINAALKGNDPSKFNIVGRIGGHSLVMDDGELFSGRNQLIRLRSAGGHQITMSDDGQVLFITHSNGESWVELGPQGTVDVYARNSFNVRTQGDINFHADRDINIHAKRNFNVNAENINHQSVQNTTMRVGGDSTYHTLGTHTHKVGAALSMGAGGDASLTGSVTYIEGKPINLNTGSSGTQPKDVPAAQLTKHVETQFSQEKGWMYPAENPTPSITTRLPTHQPWAMAAKGVDAETPLNPGAATQPSGPVANATTQAAANPPATMVTPELAKTVPAQQASPTNSSLPAPVKQAITSQNAAIAATMSAAEKAQAGIIPGVAGINVNQLENAGILKPGVADLAKDLMARGVPFEQAVSPSSFTGAMGINSAEAIISNQNLQAMIASSSLDNAGLKMIDAGIITGKESPTEIAGLVNAVSQTSAGTVAAQLVAAAANPVSSTIPQAGATTTGTTTAVSTGGTSLLASVSSAISAGTFAAGMADKLLSGSGALPTSLSDLKSSITGGIDKLVGGISTGATNLKTGFTSAFDSIKSVGQNAFASVEASFTNLKAGVPNSLGGAQAQSPDSPETMAANEYEIAVAEKAAAEEEFFEAQRYYYDYPTPENLADVQAADAKIAAANKKIAAASDAFLKTGTGMQVAGVFGNIAGGALPAGSTPFSIESIQAQVANVQSGNASVATTLNSGVNALPGGLGSMVAENKAAATNILTSGSALLGLPSSTTLSSAKGAFDQLKAMGSPTAIAISTEASSVASGTTGETPPTASTNSQPLAQLTAKIGALFGDARIPLPPLKPVEPTAVETPEEADETVSAKEKALQDIRNAELNLRLTKASPVGSIPAVVKDAEQKLEMARLAYQNIVNSEA